MSHKCAIAMLLLSIVFLGKFSPGRARALPTEPEAVTAMMAGQVGSHPKHFEAAPEGSGVPGVPGAPGGMRPLRLWLLESMDFPFLGAGDAVMDEQDRPAMLDDALMTGQWFDTRLIRVIAPQRLLEHLQRRSAHRWATPMAPSR